MSGKHTPGPWRLVADATMSSNLRVTSNARPHIAKVYARSPALDPECEANARLISAAPDLVEALSFYVAICGNTANTVDRESARQAYEMARAALSKAKEPIR